MTRVAITSKSKATPPTVPPAMYAVLKALWLEDAIADEDDDGELMQEC